MQCWHVPDRPAPLSQLHHIKLDDLCTAHTQRERQQQAVRVFHSLAREQQDYLNKLVLSRVIRKEQEQKKRLRLHFLHQVEEYQQQQQKK
jgi:hypothetical protein